MKQLRISVNKRNALVATITGSSFLVSFLLFVPLLEDLLLHMYPSQYEDDVRFDLFIPMFGSAYMASSLVSILIGWVVCKLVRKKYIYKTHLFFILIAPLLFIIAYLIIVAIFFLFMGLNFHNEILDDFIVYIVGFAVIIAGYYRLLNGPQSPK